MQQIFQFNLKQYTRLSYDYQDLIREIQQLIVLTFKCVFEPTIESRSEE